MTSTHSSFSVFAARACLLLLLVSGAAFATSQDAPKDHRYYLKQAVVAYEKKDFVAYRENLGRARELRPTNPTILYNLAGALALTGEGDRALDLLERVAAMGMVLPVAEDEDFAAIEKSPRFTKILDRIVANRQPVSNSDVGFRLQEKGLITEGIAFDPKDEAFFIGSIHRRKILKVDRGGKTAEFADRTDGLWSVFGMRVDAKRRVLWVCTSAMRQMEGFDETVAGKAAVLKFDLESGKVLARFVPPDDSEPHLFGDLTLDEQGHVVVSDSMTQTLYSIAPSASRMEVFLDTDEFVSLQGLDFGDDGRYLFVADYSKGLFRVDRSSRRVQLIEHPQTATLLGTDGLYSVGDHLYAIQNGIRPHRLVKITLDEDRSRVTSVEVREANNPVFDEPTLGVVAKGYLFFIANSQWGAVDESGRLAPDEKLTLPVILKSKL